jgi:hypothetical protein
MPQKILVGLLILTGSEFNQVNKTEKSGYA